MTTLGDVQFFDRDLNLLCILPHAISSDWQLRHRDVGTAELHFEKTDEIIALLTSHKFLFLQQGEHQGFVTGFRIGADCAVFARTPDWLLKKFVVVDFAPRANTASAVVCEMVESVLSDVPLVITGKDTDQTVLTTFPVSDGMDLYTAILNCIADEKTGFSLRFHYPEKNFSFCVYQGEKRTHPILSEEVRTLFDTVYTCDKQPETSGGLFYFKLRNCGEWNPSSNSPVLQTNPKHYGTYYTVSKTCDTTVFGFGVEKGDIIACKDKTGRFRLVTSVEPSLVEIPPEETGIFAWKSMLSASNEDEALIELSSKKTKNIIEGISKNVQFGTDFYVGDILTAEYVAGTFHIQEQRIIKSVHLWEDASSFGCLPEMSNLERKEE